MANVNVYGAIGSGCCPSLFTDRGGWRLKTQLNKLEEDIRMLLMTSKGTLIGDPSYGSDLYRIIYYGNTSATASRIRYEIADCLAEHYPQVKIISVDVEFNENSVIMNIHYNIDYSNVSSNMMLEFIKNEGGN